ncbi:O-antigen ligase family protein [Vibrio lentus]|uniref:O-antigen ligase family protein n=2 Tax=Vibrio lentus TaxID=136468 RepID=UPI0021C48C92|nr:O-antigen ligase family protein [Vibrio lentus]MDN3630545.1 O-antigen ligase family protein [Vibrio lentus]
MSRNILAVRFSAFAIFILFASPVFNFSVYKIGSSDIRLGYVLFLLGFLFIRTPKTISSYYLLFILLINAYIAMKSSSLFLFAWPIMMIGSYYIGKEISKVYSLYKEEVNYLVKKLSISLILVFIIFNFYEVILVANGTNPKTAIYYYLGYYSHFNIAATSAFLLAILFIEDKKMFFTLVFFGLSITLINSSRTGFLAFLACIYYYNVVNNIFKAKMSYLLMLGGVFFLLLFLVKIFFPEMFLRLFDFEQEIEYFHTGQGRLALWKAAFETFQQNYWGYGIGNSKEAMLNSASFDLWYREDAVHNIYIQTLIDNGFVSFLLLIFVFFKFFKNRYVSNVHYFCFLFLFLSLFQNSGYEHIIWFFIGFSEE